jgi:proteasome accessory factor A
MGRNGYDMRIGGTKTAAEIQQAIIKLIRTQQEAGNMVLSDEDGWTLDEWEKAAADIIQKPSLLKRRADWMTKYYRLERTVHQKNGIAWASEEMRAQDRFYDYIGPNHVIDYLREQVWNEYMPSRELIEQRITTAPEHTRARLRGAFVLACSGDSRARAEWHQLVYLATQMKINNIYEYQNTEVEEFIENYLRSKETNQ